MPHETLALGLYSPDLFRGGKATVEALRTDYLFGPKTGHTLFCGDSTGVSASRVEADPTQAELAAVLKDLCADKNRTIEGSALISVMRLEAIRTSDGAQVFCALDDGREGYASHAVIRALSGLKKSALRDPRDRLLDLLNERLDQRPIG